MRKSLLAALIACFLSGACAHDQIVPAPETFDSFVTAFTDGYLRMNVVFAVNAGRHERDGEIPDFSPAALQSLGAWLHSMRLRATALKPGALTGRQQFDRDLVIARIDHDLFWLESARDPYRNPMYYAGLLSPSVYLTREYAPPEIRLRAYTKYLRNVPQAMVQMRSNIARPMARPFAEVGKGVFEGLATYYRGEALQIFAGVGDAAAQGDLRSATEAAARAADDAGHWFAEALPTADNHYALGPELFHEMLVATERVDLPLDQLEAIGRRDLDHNKEALKDACAQYAPGVTVAQCVARSESIKPPEGPVPAAARQLVELRAFVIDHKIVTVPTDEQAKVAEAPPYKATNTAYIETPGPYEPALPSTYYIAPPEPGWTAEEKAAYIPSRSFLLWITVHEVWPGHFLNHLVQERDPYPIERLFHDYAYSEGWAHYSEEMMWDEGLTGGDPEMHIGQLLNAILRDVRFLSAIGLHTKGMTVEQSEQMFRDDAFRDPGNARQQAHRGTYDPAYLNYTLGKLMIRKLRDDWCASRGGRAAWSQFHDAFLSYEGAPVPLVRHAMLGNGPGSMF